jgi:hypothetical protein
MNLAMCQALDAIERGSCLEFYFGSNCLVVDPQIAGFDDSGRPVVLGVERASERAAPLARWLLLRLDGTIRVDVSGYLSDGRRPGLEDVSGQFALVEASAH